jgi:hypothetical protein
MKTWSERKCTKITGIYANEVDKLKWKFEGSVTVLIKKLQSKMFPNGRQKSNEFNEYAVSTAHHLFIIKC